MSKEPALSDMNDEECVTSYLNDVYTVRSDSRQCLHLETILLHRPGHRILHPRRIDLPMFRPSESHGQRPPLGSAVRFRNFGGYRQRYLRSIRKVDI